MEEAADAVEVGEAPDEQRTARGARQAPIDRSHEGLWQGRACGRFILGTGKACGRFDLNVYETTLAVHGKHAQVDADDCG